MSKGKKDRSGAKTSGSSGSGGSQPAKAARKPMGTVTDRLFDKASRAYDLAADALKLARGRGVAEEITTAMDKFMVDVGAWRDQLKVLQESGWQPVEKSAMKQIKEGDAIGIAPDHRGTYSFIPEGTKLVAGQIDLTKKGRVSRILLKRPADGQPGDLDGLGQPAYVAETIYGWAPLAHIVRR